MTMTSSKLDPNHPKLFKWAKEQGCEINKIAPAQFEFGVGVIATEDIKAGEQIAHVPTHCLLNLLTLPSLPNTSPVTRPNTAHGFLAAHVANSVGGDGGDAITESWKEWVDVLPSWESFKAGMPMFWDDEKFQLLPSGTRQYATKQKKQILDDYNRAKPLGLKYTEEQYKWGWSVVNSRTIYYRPRKWAKIPTADCLCMCPIIDYINHECEKNEDACMVQFSTDGISATTRKPYKKGEQLFVTYGSHSNDALLCEYGFTLDDNQWDSVILDSYVVDLLSPEHKKVADEYSSSMPSGECAITPTATSFRLSILLHLSLLSPTNIANPSSPAFKNWKRMLSGEEKDVKGAVSAAQLQQRTNEVCKDALLEAEQKTETLGKMIKESGNSEDVEYYGVIKQRWEQVGRILKGYLEGEGK